MTNWDYPEARAELTLAATTIDHGPHDARVLVLTELAGIHHELRLVRSLIDTRQAGLGFLTVEAAKVQNDLIRSERRDRLRNAKEGIQITGAVPAPGSISAYSLLGEWRTLLADIETTTTARLARAGVCHLITRPTGGDIDDTIRYARACELIALTNRTTWLNRVHADATDLHTRVTRCIDGNQVKAMPDPCPWCGHQTLVADLTEGVIRCGRDPHTGNYEPCTCSDSFCPCHTAGRHRHTWHRDHKAHKTTSWQGLRHAINAHAEEGDNQ